MISLADLQRRIDSGELSPEAAIAQSFEAIAASEKTIGAFVCHDTGRARPEHRPAARHRGRHQGHHRYRGLSDRMGSAIYRGFQPKADASVVMVLNSRARPSSARPRRRLASSDPTATLNPHNHGHTPGGSSSGSAAAVGGRHDPAGAGNADRRFGDPAGSFCGARQSNRPTG